VATRPECLDGIDDDEKEKKSPEKECKGDGSFGTATECVCAAVRMAPPHSESNGASEPEDHSDPLENHRGQSVEEVGEIKRRQANVGKYEQRPDRVEDQERHGAWPPPGAIFGSDWKVKGGD
jgi:hypothetical protein